MLRHFLVKLNSQKAFLGVSLQCGNQLCISSFLIYFYVYADMAFCNSHTWPEGHLWSCYFKPILEHHVFSALDLYCNFWLVTTYLPFCLSGLSICVCNNFNLLLRWKIYNSFLMYTVVLILYVYWAAEYRRSSFVVFVYYVALLVSIFQNKSTRTVMVYNMLLSVSLCYNFCMYFFIFFF